MSTRPRTLVAKKACLRCSTQKRRCDKALPDCGLCVRLRQPCMYEGSQIPSSGPTPSLSPAPLMSVGPGNMTPSHLKDAIVQRIRPLTPEETLLVYCRVIEPWFPIVSASRLRSRLPPTWDEAPLDLALLCLSFVLLTTTPPLFAEDEDNPSEFKSLYLYIKSTLAFTEGLGINSLLVVQSRILVTLFEVVHGFHRAAFISIGATVRATEALEVYPCEDSSSSESSDDSGRREDQVFCWGGILILDRYIAVDSGPHPPITRSMPYIVEDILKPTICLTHMYVPDLGSPLHRISRLFEASSLLDKIHTTLNSPTAEDTFNIEELMLAVQTLLNLQTVITDEIGDGIQLYSGGFGFCKTALLLAFENGSRVPFAAGVTEVCNSIATTSLVSILPTIVDMVEAFVMGEKSIDFNLLPPFVTLLVYKTAVVVTGRLFMCSNSNEGLRILGILRKFLKIMKERWLCAERYLQLLDDDTTPRTLKAINSLPIH